MKKKLVVVLLMMIGVALPVPTHSGLVFTGNVPADFTAAGVVIIVDPGGVVDVGMPPGPPGVSGWETAALYFDYDHHTDVLYIGVDTVSICGDADGDSNPGGTSAWLAGRGGVDFANLQNTEAFCLLIDLDNDYVPLSGGPGFDVVVGVDIVNDITTFDVYTFVGNPFTPELGFGAALPNTVTVFANPSAAAPDMEFSIANFSTLPGATFTPGNAFSFQVNFFQGSQQDNGIGEDYIPGAGDTSTVTIAMPQPQDSCPIPVLEQIHPLAYYTLSQAEHLFEDTKRICENLIEKRDSPHTGCCTSRLDKVIELLMMAEEAYACGNYIAANNLALEAIKLLEEIIECIE
jgi:hypothetical protein